MKWFTIFWLDGSKSFVFGNTIEAACNNSGIGNGAIRAIDWYDEGIRNTHYWDKETKKWVKYGEFEVDLEKFSTMTRDDLVTIMEKNSSITVKFPTDDILSFIRDTGLFYLRDKKAWVDYLSISFGEYFEQGYFDEDTNGCYMMANSQMFAPDDLEHALDTFIKRTKETPFIAFRSEYCKSMELIHENQKIAYQE